MIDERAARVARTGTIVAQSDNVVEVRDLAFSYGKRAALAGISFTVPRGQAVALLGHNGAGKTTTIRVLNGLLRPDAGWVRVLGLDPTTDGEELRRHTSVVTDSLGLHDRDTPRRTLEYHARLWGMSSEETVDRGVALLERFGLGDRIDDRIKSFSRGMRQRLAIARSLLNDPKLLLLDEPTLGMDPVARQDFRDLLAELQRSGVSVVISTHDLSEVERVCDRLVIIQHGRTIIEGTPQECIQPFLRNVEVEIECLVAPGVSAREALRSLDGMSGLHFEGWHALFRASQPATIANAVAALVSNDVGVVGVGTRSPSLEDVYLRVHEADRP